MAGVGVRNHARDVFNNANWQVIIDHHTTSEAVSNGVWYEILRRHFPFPDFVITPEQRNNNGGRPDLTVYRVSAGPDWEPIFSFEGKSPGHQGQVRMENAILQAINYLPALSHATLAQGRRFGMVASGSSFVLMVYNGGNAAAVNQWIRADADVQRHNMAAGWDLWSLTNANQRATLDSFLTHFVRLF